MQYVVLRKKSESANLFTDRESTAFETTPLTFRQYQELIAYLEKKNKPAILPMQIAYFTGLRLGEICRLAWQDINLDEQYLTVRKSVLYNSARHKTEIGPTKRKKVRTVDFSDTLTRILRKAKQEQHRQRLQCRQLYHLNYYREVTEKTGCIMNYTIWTA